MDFLRESADFQTARGHNQANPQKGEFSKEETQCVFHRLTGMALAASVAFAPLAHADITIGVITPLTGPVAAFGEQVKNGAEAAIEAINSAGRRQWRETCRQDRRRRGRTQAGRLGRHQLAGEGIKYVVGPVLSGTSMPASDVLAENGILMVTPTRNDPGLTTRGLWNVLRTCDANDQQARGRRDYVVKTSRTSASRSFTTREPMARVLPTASRLRSTQAASPEVVYEGLTPGEKDFGAIVTRLKSENVDVVYFGGYHTRRAGCSLARCMTRA
ncbi:ABC transporter substrate-binding protein [Sinorhizobium meliloti]|nr:ABC transporter substrate-binding protein [Sinorhizobium meliloti]